MKNCRKICCVIVVFLSLTIVSVIPSISAKSIPKSAEEDNSVLWEYSKDKIVTEIRLYNNFTEVKEAGEKIKNKDNITLFLISATRIGDTENFIAMYASELNNNINYSLEDAPQSCVYSTPNEQMQWEE